MGEFRDFVEADEGAAHCQQCGRECQKQDTTVCSRCKKRCCGSCLTHKSIYSGSVCHECRGIEEGERWTPAAKAKREEARQRYIDSSRRLHGW